MTLKINLIIILDFFKILSFVVDTISTEDLKSLNYTFFVYGLCKEQTEEYDE